MFSAKDLLTSYQHTDQQQHAAQASLLLDAKRDKRQTAERRQRR